MPRAILCFAIAAVLAGCGDTADREAAARDTTRRARDSVLGASRLPGAHGVSGALKGADSAAARRAREDSISGSP
jgi:hypothetical protein